MINLQKFIGNKLLEIYLLKINKSDDHYKFMSNTTMGNLLG